MDGFAGRFRHPGPAAWGVRGPWGARPSWRRRLTCGTATVGGPRGEQQPRSEGGVAAAWRGDRTCVGDWSGAGLG
jgi:hypothetical protein